MSGVDAEPLNLAQLRRTAEGALTFNDGQSWQIDPGKQYEVEPSVFYPIPETKTGIDREVIAKDLEYGDAEYIATFDPPMVLRLLDALDASGALLGQLEAFAKNQALNAKARGQNDRGWLDLLILLEKAVQS